MRCIDIKLGGVRASQADHVTCEFDGGDLHAKTNSQIRNLIFTGKFHRGNLAFGAAFAKATRHQNRVHAREHIDAGLFHILGIEIVNIDAGARLDAGVNQRFGKRLVRVCQAHVFADHRQIDFGSRVLQRVNDLIPLGEIGRLWRQVQFAADDFIKTLLVQHLGNLVDGSRVVARNHRAFFDVGEQRNLAPLFFRQWAIATTHHHIGLDTDLAQLLDAVLGGLGFYFTDGRQIRHQREVDITDVFAPLLNTHLANRFEKRQRLDVAHRSADFDDAHFGVHRAGNNRVLDFVGDMRDHLHGRAEVITAAFFVDHAFINLTGGEVVGLFHLG